MGKYLDFIPITDDEVLIVKEADEEIIHKGRPQALKVVWDTRMIEVTPGLSVTEREEAIEELLRLYGLSMFRAVRREKGDAA